MPFFVGSKFSLCNLDHNVVLLPKGILNSGVSRDELIRANVCREILNFPPTELIVIPSLDVETSCPERTNILGDLREEVNVVSRVKVVKELVVPHPSVTCGIKHNNIGLERVDESKILIREFKSESLLDIFRPPSLSK